MLRIVILSIELSLFVYGFRLLQMLLVDNYYSLKPYVHNK